MGEQFNDRGPFRVGEVCIIVKTMSFPELLGREVTIIAPPGHGVIAKSGDLIIGYEVDLVHKGLRIGVPEDCLRRKRPPTTGEQIIRAMFDAPPVERRETTTAWQAQYSTMQALMAMGVRVRPGKWPVEVEV